MSVLHFAQFIFCKCIFIYMSTWLFIGRLCNTSPKRKLSLLFSGSWMILLGWQKIIFILFSDHKSDPWLNIHWHLNIITIYKLLCVLFLSCKVAPWNFHEFNSLLLLLYLLFMRLHVHTKCLIIIIIIGDWVTTNLLKFLAPFSVALQTLGCCRVGQTTTGLQIL